MYKLFLKIATRYLLKNKLYSFINIFGLAIGIASFVLIMLYVKYEQSYDTFEGSENVYRVYMDYTEEGVFVPGDAQSYNLSGPTLKEAFPEIIGYTRMSHLSDIIFNYDNNIIEGQKGALADASVFEILKYQLVKGDVKTVLQDPFTILLTESLAKTIFGSEDPMGKAIPLVYGGSTLFTVNGILKDFPKNTHIKNDFLISFNTFLTWESYRDPQELNWNGNSYFTYIEVDENANADVLKQKIMDFKVESLPYERHNIEPLEDIHLYSDKPYEAELNGSAQRIRFLMAIAFIIIILSWLNYINLSTTKSLERAKETGIRKVAGAQKSQLILQSFLESFLLNFIAILIAVVIVLVVLPSFNNYVGKELTISLRTIKNLLPILFFILFGTILSGIYPAIVLSNYNPAKALKGKINSSLTGLAVRKGLIIGQFLATIILLIGTITVTKQINLLRHQPIGADLDQVLALNGTMLGNTTDSILLKDYRMLKDELKQFPFVKETTLAQTYPGGHYSNLGSTVGITFPDGTRDDTRIHYQYAVDQDYFKLMDIKFVAGGVFLKNSNGHSNDIVMNEKFIKYMGIHKMEDAIGSTVKFWGQDWVIVGVIQNYHHFGLKTRIEPLMLRYDTTTKNLLVKLDASATSSVGFESSIAQIKSEWTRIFPKSTFNYTFLDQKFEAQYKEDKAFGAAFQVFTVLAILIAAMGLFGLTSYTVVQRKKEIGIRKVNGATIPQVLTLLNRDFVKWVCVAFIIAVPISWYAMNHWLEGFAYRTTLSWWVFALAGITALLIALLTVSWQSFQAAIANPVDSLRNE
jgi:putative ABC transport system permease protein